MKLPCETVIIDILPVIRKELSVRLVETHGMMKSKVAKIFDVSGTAISQYIHGTRGNSTIMTDSPCYEGLMNEINISADKIALGECAVIDELCRLCEYAKCVGMHEHLHNKGRDNRPLMRCAECPRHDM